MVKIRRVAPHRAAVRRWIASADDPRPNPIAAPCAVCGGPSRLALIHHPRYFGSDALRPPPGVCGWAHYLEALAAELGDSAAFRIFFESFVDLRKKDSESA